MYEDHGGWLAAGGLSIAVMGASYIVILARGPHERGWVGWSGGWRLKSSLEDREERLGGESGEVVEVQCEK